MKIEIIKEDINFGGIVSEIDITEDLNDTIINELDKKLNELCLLVFKKQKINDDQQIKFSKYFGKIEGAGNNTTIRSIKERRLSDSFGDVSNLDVNNRPLRKTDNKRFFALGNRLWHTDASFKKIPAKYSLLSGRKVAKIGGETQFADMRAAYDDLSREWKAFFNKEENNVDQIYKDLTNELTDSVINIDNSFSSLTISIALPPKT